MELDVQPGAPPVHYLDAQALCGALQLGELEKRFHRVGQWTIAVRQLRARTFGLLIFLYIGDFFIRPQALLLVRNVLRRDADIQA